MKAYFLLPFFLFGLMMNSGYGQKTVANIAGYDTSRIYYAMTKARRGEDITIAVIGGSITAGYAASTTAKQWGSQVNQWWVDSFPQSTVHFINAGVGGTGSSIGTFRIKEDVLDKDPDFIVVEFSVNDSEGDEAKKMMEALIRQILLHDSLPGVMMLMLKQENGATAQESHKPVGNHYDVPMISFADLIDSAVAADGVVLHDLYLDGLHPVDLGMTYIANFIKTELINIYNDFPADSLLPDIDTVVPAPLVTDVYDNNFTYNAQTLVPLSNQGWTVNSTIWESHALDDEISFRVEGNALAVLYNRHNATERGQIAVWVDSDDPDTLDAYWTETWGPGKVIRIIAEGLSDGEHILHARTLASHSSGSTGNFFPMLNIMKAGNISGCAPIALAGGTIKCVAGDEVTLDGSESFDPDGDSLVSYHWSVVSRPSGSSSNVVDSMLVVASFTPDAGGTFVVGLEVNDGVFSSVIFNKTINVKASNAAPVANAGTDRRVLVNKGVYLDGSQSSDPDGDSLVYMWRVITEPAGSSISLGGYNTPYASFRNRTLGDYLFGLTVYDSIVYSAEDTVVVTAAETLIGLNDKVIENELEIFPNPAHDWVTITCKMDENSKVSMMLYSIDGKESYPLPNKMLSKGLNEYQLDLKKVAVRNGIYILRLTAGDEIYHHKIVLY